MFEHEIETAPRGSDRLANYLIAQGVVAAIDRLNDTVGLLYVQLGRERGVKITPSDIIGPGPVDVVLPDQMELPLDPPEDAFPKFDSGESFEAVDDQSTTKAMAEKFDEALNEVSGE
jgi:hypothetical protein